MAKEDLQPCRDSAEAKKRGRNGGLASGKARRQKKALRELVRIALEEKHIDNYSDKYNGKTQGEVIAARLVSKAALGDVSAMKLLFSLEAESKQETEEEKDTETVEA